jgi:hypothetical protein
VKENTKPHRSISSLVSSNGFGAIIYSAEKHQIIAFHEHIYKITSDKKVTQNLIYGANFTVELNGQKYNLSEIPEDELGYINGTGIISASYKKLGVQVFYFMTYQVNAPVMVAICKVNKKYKQSKNLFQRQHALWTDFI